MTQSDKSRLTTTELKFSLANDAINAQIVNTDTNEFTFSGVGGTASVLLKNATAPVDPSDVANKQYVDNIAVGLTWKTAVVAASTTDVSLSGSQTIDGIAVVANDRVLVKNQNNGVENGIYVVADPGAWARSADMPAGSDPSGDAVFVQQGTVNADKAYVCTTDNGTVGSTALTFELFASLNPGTAGGATGTIQYNNGGGFGGVSSWSSNGTTTLSASTGASMTLADGSTVVFGNSSDLTIQHTGTDSTIVNTTGDLVLSNTNPSGNILLDLGNTEVALGVVSPAGVVFTVSGTGNIDSATGNLNLSSGTIFAGSGDGTSTIGSTLESTTTSNGAFVVGGGVGIGGNLNVGGNFVAGSSTLASLNVDGDFVAITSTVSSMAVTNQLYVGGDFTAGSSTVASMAVTNELNVGGNLTAAASTLTSLSVVGVSYLDGGMSTTSATVGDLSVTNNMEVVGSSSLNSLSATGNVVITSNTASVDTSTGSLVVSGGVGILGDLNVGGTATFNGLDINGTATLEALAVTLDAQINGTTESTNVGEGAFVVQGGVGIGGNLNVGGSLTAGLTTLNSLVTSTITNQAATSLTLSNNNPTFPVIVSTLDGNFEIQNGTNASVAVGPITTNFLSTEDSLNFNQGAVVVDGGMGIEKNLYVGGNFGVTGILEAGSSTIASLAVSGDFNAGSSTVASISVVGGSYMSTLDVSGASSLNSLSATGDVVLTSSTVSDSPTTGALVVSGGVGIVGNLNVGGTATFNGLDINGTATLDGLAVTLDVQINGTAQSTDTSTGSLVVLGGTAVQKNLNVGGDIGLQTSGARVYFGDLTQSSLGFNGTDTSMIVDVGVFEVVGTTYTGFMNFSADTGVLNVSGNVESANGNLSAVQGTVFAGSLDGTNTFASTVQSTATTNGAVIVGGGVGIGKNLNVGGSLNAGDSTLSSLTVSGATSLNTLSAGVSTISSLVVTSGSTLDSVVVSGSLTAGASTLSSLVVSGTSVLDTLSAGSTTLSGLTVNGDVFATAFNATSDATLKTNIEHLTGSLDQLKRIEGYQYNWKDERMGEEIQYGVLAQQLEEAGLGHLVAKGDHKSVNYLGLIPILIEAVKELSDKLELKKDLF